MAATIRVPADGPPFGPGGRGGIRGSSEDSAPRVDVDADACAVGDWFRTAADGRLAEVNGAFALAWSDGRGTLSLARDPVGERTLYYAVTDGVLRYASDVRGLLDSGRVDRTLDLAGLSLYLCTAYVPGRRTLVEGVHEVLPGEIVRFRDGRLSRERYADVPAGPAREDVDEASLARLLRDGVEQAVRRRLPERGPVAATLSGGLDSSLVVALARRLHDAPVHTFSISFGEGMPNELPWSTLVAEHCGTVHRVVELSPAAVLRHLDGTIARLSDPIGDPLTVPNALVFREAAEASGVVLNGEGGDPCFGGPKNLPMLLDEHLGDALSAPAQGVRARARSYLRSHQKCFDDLDAMLLPEARAAMADAALETFLAPYFEDPRWTRFVDRLMWMNVVLKGAHHILPKVDALSRPSGVVARSPLFDREVVRAAFGIPAQLKLRGTVEKYLLKRAVEDVLPREILDRPKSGMLVPVEAWCRGPLQPAARERLLDGLAPYGLFDRRWLERLVAGRLGGWRPRHGAKIWLLLTLEAWLRTVFSPPA